MTAAEQRSAVALHFTNDKLGLALFKADEGAILLLQKEQTGVSRDMIHSLFTEQSELLVLTSTRSDVTRIREALPVHCQFLLQPAVDFDPCNLTSKELTAKVDMSETPANSLAALAGLMSYMRSAGHDFSLPIAVSALSPDCNNVLCVDQATLKALQIFDEDPHPNMHSVSRTKDRFSVFSMMNHTASSLGRSKLKCWFAKPLCSREAINDRLDAIELLKSVMTKDFDDTLRNALRGLTSVAKPLTDLKFRPSAKDLLSIAKTCKSVQDIRNSLIQAHPEETCANSAMLQALLNKDYDALKELEEAIGCVLDDRAAGTSEIYTVRKFVAPHLDQLRENYQHLPDLLSAVVQDIAKDIEDGHFESINTVYFPQLGFLITIPIGDRDPVAIGEQFGFELQFLSDKIAYFKNQRMRDLDEDIGDIYADIIDCQLEIMQQLCTSVFASEDLLLRAVELCSEIDCIFSLACAAAHHQLSRPTVSDSRGLEIHEGRHLLVESVCTPFISNDCIMDGNRMVVLTGANSSGKSIYLKQVGIIAFLAHVGSFVPAASASVSLLDRIMTRMKAPEDLAKGDSSFMAELRQAKALIESYTDRSLVLIDEFGKGTCDQDGLALFSGLLGFFAEQPTQPLLIATTHLHEIFKLKLVDNETEKFKYQRMRVVREQSRLYMLYRIEDGLTEHSYAIECAEEAGLPKHIAKRATHLLEALEKGISPEELRHHGQLHNDHQLQKALKRIRTNTPL